MVDLRKKYEMDESAETEGVWTVLPSGVEARIARLPNEEFQRAYQALPQGVQQVLGGEEGAAESEVDEKTREYMADLVSRTVLRDWRDVYYDSDEPTPYTPEVGCQVLQEFPDLLRDVIQFARARGNFLRSRMQDNAGKSRSGSAGTSAGRQTESSSSDDS